MTDFQSDSYDNVIVIANERSSGYTRMNQALGALAIEPRIIPTSRNYDEIHDAVYDLANERSRLLSWGGDGTTHLVVNMLQSEAARQSGVGELAYAPLPGGDANDIALSINGRMALPRLLRKAAIVPVHPLQVTVNDDPSRYAAGYCTIGGSAAATQGLNHLKTARGWHQKHELLKVARQSIQSWLETADYPEFTVTSPSGEQQIATDVLFLRANRIAKFGRPHSDLALPLFESLIVASRGRAHTLGVMVALAMNNLNSGTMNQQAELLVNSADSEPLPVQYDGEVALVESGSLITIGLARRPINLLSTKL